KINLLIYYSISLLFVIHIINLLFSAEVSNLKMHSGKSNQFGYFCLSLSKRCCRMNIYNRSSLVAFYKKHSDCKETLEKWYHDVLSKSWRKPGDITGDFKTARAI